MNREQALLDLETLHKDLAAFVYQTLIEHKQPDTAGAQAVMISPAFHDYWWRNSPLFRRIRVSLPVENEYLVSFVGFLEDRFDLGKEFDQEAHERREQIGQAWGMLKLLPLLSDVTFYRRLTFATYAHLLRSFNLRLRSYRAELPGIRLPADLGLPSQPLRWSLGPFSIFWVYAAYMISVAARQVNPIARRRMQDAGRRAITFIERYSNRLTPGDLILADALVTALLADEKLTWDDLAILARSSPISRICRLDDFFRLANGSEEKLINGLRPAGLPQKSEALLILAGSDELPGIHHACAQHLANACRPGRPICLLEEAAQTIYSMAVDRYYPLKETGNKPTEADYQTGAMLLRTYLLAQRDGFLREAAARQPNFAAALPLHSAPLLDMLFEASRRLEPPIGSGLGFWLNKQTRTSYENLVKEMSIYG